MSEVAVCGVCFWGVWFVLFWVRNASKRGTQCDLYVTKIPYLRLPGKYYTSNFIYRKAFLLRIVQSSESPVGGSSEG
jgi:hypothetical protein